MKEVLGNILTHIGSGVASEKDAALEILLSLVATMPDEVRPLAVFIQGTPHYTTLHHITLTL